MLHCLALNLAEGILVDILLALGGVASSHYDVVMQKMHELGMNPRLVRISTPFHTEGDFQDAAIKRVPNGLTSERADEYVACWIEQKKREIIREAFGSAQLNDVKGVIQSAEKLPGFLDWLLERLPATYAEHLVYTGEDDETWIEGDFGHLEPLTSN